MDSSVSGEGVSVEGLRLGPRMRFSTLRPRPSQVWQRTVASMETCGGSWHLWGPRFTPKSIEKPEDLRPAPEFTKQPWPHVSYSPNVKGITCISGSIIGVLNGDTRRSDPKPEGY